LRQAYPKGRARALDRQVEESVEYLAGLVAEAREGRIAGHAGFDSWDGYVEAQVFGALRAAAYPGRSVGPDDTQHEERGKTPSPAGSATSRGAPGPAPLDRTDVTPRWKQRDTPRKER
jgi:hypothetical protein